MKRIYEGWLARDKDGSLYLGQYKPVDDHGIFTHLGNNMELSKSDFPQVKYKNSPVNAIVTIEVAVESYKQKIEVDKPFSPVIGALPCVLGCGKVKGTFVYVVEVEGATQLARQGDVIAQMENGEWCVISKL